jgi:hypothetical protein
VREKLKLDLDSLDRFTMLIHGDYGAGKTYLVGDFLAEESKEGPVYYINIKGEDGYLSLRAFGSSLEGETVETVGDLRAVLAELRGRNLRALGIDSLRVLYRVVSRHRVGERQPVKDDFSGIHWEGENLVAELRSVAPRVLCVCPSDKSVHHLSGRTTITPDVPGRAASGCAGWFDFVGYLRADTVGREVRRRVTFAPSGDVITRLRLPRPIVDDIILPEGPGGWLAIRNALEAALKPEK